MSKILLNLINTLFNFLNINRKPSVYGEFYELLFKKKHDTK
ncbi:MAG: hypothetical protein RLZZ540_39 [Bacteroidota bacterium]|jgi:hypothetical protein